MEHARRERVHMECRPAIDEVVAGQRAGLVLIGRGGSGKSAAVHYLIDAAASAGVPTRVVRGRRLDHDDPYSSIEDLVPFELLERIFDEPSRRDLLEARHILVADVTPGVLVVEDAQWVDSASLVLLTALASSVEAGGCRLMVTHRPRSSRSDLAALAEMLSHTGQPIVLQRMSEREFGETDVDLPAWLTEPAALEHLAAATDGAPFVVDAVRAAAVADPVATQEWLDRGPCPQSVVEAVRARLGHLNSAARALLVALSYGASPTSDELGELLGLDDPRVVGDAAGELDDEGLLTEGGADVIPVVAEATTALQPPAERRHHHLRFAAVLAARGGSVVERVEHLQAAGAPPNDLAEVYLDAADELMNEAPTLALEWLDRAADAGVSPPLLAGRLVDAHLREGHPLNAVRAAEPLFGSDAPDRIAGLQRAARAFVQARRPHQAASILTQLLARLDGDAERIATMGAFVCHASAGTGLPLDTDVATTPFEGSADPAVEVARLVARSVACLLVDDIDDAMASATEACELELAAIAEPRFPLSATVVAPTIALYGADLGLASRLARRALAAPSPTDAQRHSRVLQNALIEMWAGASEVRVDPMDGWESLGPTDRLVACAVATGLARRANDNARLHALSERLMEVLMLPPDLMSLPLYGEVMAGVARIGGMDRVVDARRMRDGLLAELGAPGVLELSACWSDLSVIISSDTGDELDGLVTRLERLGDVGGPRHGVLVGAMATWCEVLLGTADPEATVAAGHGLQQLGFGWEATRLVGAAAIRRDDSQSTKELLAVARELRSSIPLGDADAPLSALLSSRELEVAHLLVEGHTYKVIGSRLYISPKTVEHHVARIRQRLVASTRGEMLERLRVELVGSPD